MENNCLTFLTPTLIDGTRNWTHLINHEMSHSWTGNLVTNSNWKDFWLNEGFTVFIEDKNTRNVLGNDKGQLIFYEH